MRSVMTNQTLLLFPTDLEYQRFQDQGGLGNAKATEAICGFGPAAAGARASQLIARHTPDRVLLVGIAGTYDEVSNPVGSALAFTSVAIDGIGAGRGASFKGPPALGYPQWPGSEETTPMPVEDRIDLESPAGTPPALLLTTCAASDSPEHAAERTARHPDAVAEDMEGFAVAMACVLNQVPFAIVRGISNLVGDREPGHWRIPGALAAARRVALEVLAEAEWRAEATAPARPRA